MMNKRFVMVLPGLYCLATTAAEGSTTPRRRLSRRGSRRIGPGTNYLDLQAEVKIMNAPFAMNTWEK